MANSWQGGGSYTSRGGLSSRHQDQVQINMDKFDFDAEVEGLRSYVGRMKDMSKAIEEERKAQGEVINSLEEAMNKASMALKRTSRRLNVAYKQAQSNHLLFLVLFAIAIVLGVYILAKLYRLGHRMFG